MELTAVAHRRLFASAVRDRDVFTFGVSTESLLLSSLLEQDIAERKFVTVPTLFEIFDRGDTSECLLVEEPSASVGVNKRVSELVEPVSDSISNLSTKESKLEVTSFSLFLLRSLHAAMFLVLIDDFPDVRPSAFLSETDAEHVDLSSGPGGTVFKLLPPENPRLALQPLPEKARRA